MWTSLHKAAAKNLAHTALRNGIYRLHVALNASPTDDETGMGNTKAKEIQEEDNRPGLSIDIIHMPTAVAGSTFTLVFLIFLLLMCLCCCRPSLTKFCFKRVFKDAHLHLPTRQPQQQQQQQQPTNEPAAIPIYAGQPIAPVRQAPPPPAYDHIRHAIIYQPMANPAQPVADRVQPMTDRIQEMDNPTANL